MQSIMDTENNFLPMTAPSFMFIIGMHYSEALILDQFDTSLYHIAFQLCESLGSSS